MWFLLPFVPVATSLIAAVVAHREARAIRIEIKELEEERAKHVERPLKAKSEHKTARSVAA